MRSTCVTLAVSTSSSWRQLVLGNPNDAEEIEDLVQIKLLEISAKNSTRCWGHKRRMAYVCSGGDAQLEAGRTAKYIGGRTSSPLMRSTGCRATRMWPAIVKCKLTRRVKTTMTLSTQALLSTMPPAPWRNSTRTAIGTSTTMTHRG